MTTMNPSVEIGRLLLELQQAQQDNVKAAEYGLKILEERTISQRHNEELEETLKKIQAQHKELANYWEQHELILLRSQFGNLHFFGY